MPESTNATATSTSASAASAAGASIRFNVSNEYVDVIHNDGLKTIRRAITPRQGDIIVGILNKRRVSAFQYEINALCSAVPEFAPYVTRSRIVI